MKTALVLLLFAAVIPLTAQPPTGPWSCRPASASGTTYTCNLQPAINSFPPNMSVTFIPDVTNTGPAYLNINGIGARQITQLSIPSGSGAATYLPLVANILVAGQPYTLLAFDGFANPFILQQPYTQVSVNTVANAQACPDTSVSANTITCTTVVSFNAYAKGQAVDLILANTVTGATTINIDGIGSAAVTFNGTIPMAAGIMAAGGTYRLEYDGTEWALQGSIGRSGPAPTVAAGGAIGTTPTISGTNLSGTVSVPSTAVTTGTIATVTFGAAFTNAPKCLVSQNGGLVAVGVGHGTPSTGSFTITAAIANVSAAAYLFDYTCSGF